MLDGLTQAQDNKSTDAHFLVFCTRSQFCKEEVAALPAVTSWLVVAAAADCGLQRTQINASRA